MRRIAITIALTILLLVSLGMAQQTAGNASTASTRNSSSTPPPGPILGGMGTTNYIPIWASSSFLLDSVIYQNGGNVGIGTTSPVAKLDVDGAVSSANSYEINGNNVLSIGYIGDNDLFLGVGSGIHNDTGHGTGNTFIGSSAGMSNTDGQGNTFIGAYTGYSNTTGSSNSFFGVSAGYLNTTGEGNAFYGDAAGENNSTGSGNTFIGSNAGAGNTTGQTNTFAGVSSGSSNTTGSGNVFYGIQSGTANTTGYENTFVGEFAGVENATGSLNIFIGDYAGSFNTSGTDDIYIGNEGPSSGTENNVIRIGTQGYGRNQQSAAYIAGIYGSMVDRNGVPVYVDDNGQLGTQASSLRFKQQIHDMGDSTDALMKLRPVTFLYKPEYEPGERTLQYGLIAEEVAKVYPELVAYDNDGQPYSVRYQYLSTMLLNEVQKQYHRAESEAKVIAAQQSEIQALQEQNREFQERLSRLEKLVPQTVAQK